MPVPNGKAEKEGSEMQSEVVELTRRLLAINTINPQGNEEEAARLVQDVLAAEEIDSVLQPIEPGRSNLIARLKGTGGRPALSMSAHFDTIPVDPEHWTRDAFSGEIDNGRLYGRGATDIKGGIAAMTMALIRLKRAGTKLRGDLVLNLTAAENTTLQGAKDRLFRRCGRALE